MTAIAILHQVAAKHRMSVKTLRSRCRFKHIVKARAEFIRRAHAEREMSDAQIGRMINLTSWTVHYWRHRDEHLRKARAKNAVRV